MRITSFLLLIMSLFSIQARNQYNYPKPFQWRKIEKKNAKLCKGGTWEREFADSLTTWPNHYALQMPLENFKCLNYRTTLSEEVPRNISSTDINAHNESLMCRDTYFQGCASVDFPSRKEESDATPSCFPNSDLMTQYEGKTLQGHPLFDSNSNTWTIVSASRRTQTDFAPYLPKVVVDTNLFGDSSNYYATKSVDRPYMDATEYMMILQLPSYIDGLPNIESISVVGFDPSQVSGDYQVPEFNIDLNNSFSLAPIRDGDCDLKNLGAPEEFKHTSNIDGWCFDAKSGRLYVKNGNSSSATGSFPARTVVIKFHPMGMSDCSNQELYLNQATHIYNKGKKTIGATPGSDLYYLKKLERFELLGIPEIVYEPLFCNNDVDQLVPGLFQFGNTRVDFDQAFGVFPNSPVTEDPGLNPTNKSFYQNQLNPRFGQHPIFSGHQFRCCSQLGDEVDNPKLCCSGYGKSIEHDSSSQKFQCLLPNATDLNVYFNKFVSNEGSDILDEDDFDPYTGFPKSNDQVAVKLQRLAENYCASNKAFNGAAFGRYSPRPDSGGYVYAPIGLPPYGITYNHVNDSFDPRSSDPSEGLKGRQRFNEGRRWNNHFYCGENK